MNETEIAILSKITLVSLISDYAEYCDQMEYDYEISIPRESLVECFQQLEKIVRSKGANK